MKIGINLLPLRPGKNGGMEVYLRNLMEHIIYIDTINTYYLITAPYNEHSLNFASNNYIKIILLDETGIFDKISSLLNYFTSDKRYSKKPLNEIIKKYDIDLWFCPFLSLDPRPLKIPGIVTIPDLQHEYYPENFPHEELALRKEYIRPSCEMSTKIITISKFSKNSIIEKMGINPEKIEVIYLAAGDNFTHISRKKNDILKKYDLPDQYFLYPANAWPHKNHQTLILAFNLYRKTYGDSVHLVLTGSDLRNCPAIYDLISLYRLTGVIHILDFVDKSDMPDLYRNAKALVYPSLFEGFGIPLLEAMATDCPIIASDSTSIPEVAGNAAYLFDPKNPQSICDAMHKIINDEDVRKQLITNGKSMLTLFSYEKVARRHLDLFMSLYNQAKNADITYQKKENVILSGIHPDGWISRMKLMYRGPKKFRYAHMDFIGGLPVPLSNENNDNTQ